MLKERTAADPKHTTSPMKHGAGSVMCGHLRLPMELVPLYLLMSRMNSEVFGLVLSAHIQLNASELV